MSRWLQEKDCTWDVRCMACGRSMVFMQNAACKMADRGPHPHMRCPRCTARNAGMCMFVEIVAKGSA